MRLKCLFTILFSINSIFVFSQHSITVREGEDALIWHLDNFVEKYKDADNRNYGKIDFLILSQWTWLGTPGEQVVFIKFNLPELKNAEITNAKFSLFGKTVSGKKYTDTHSALAGDNDFIIQRVISPWSQDTVTWENQPKVTTRNMIEHKGTFIPNANITDIDVTQLVKDMYANPGESYGFYLKIKTAQRYRKLVFSSFEDEENKRPLLEIDYNKISSHNKRVKIKSKEKTKKSSNEKCTIVIYDNSGKEIKRIKNVKLNKSDEIDSGTYNFNIIKKENIKASGKMIVY